MSLKDYWPLVVCLLVFVIVFSIVFVRFVTLPDYDEYVDYYSDDQIHDGWIDLNKNGRMDLYENTKLSPENRARDLVSRMTLDELIDQLAITSYIPEGEVSRLGVPPHQVGMEALHGMAGNGKASHFGTQFPKPPALAAAGNKQLVHKIYSTVGEEVRAHYNSGTCAGLWFYSPTVLDPNRDTRWQRCEESFGEDPYLVSRMGVNAIEGFQGNNDNTTYLQAIACAKHFPSNRGPLGRDHPNAEQKGPASERITREITFPPYKAAIQEAGVQSVMACYYRRPAGACWNDTPSCYSKTLLTDVLRKQWGFDEYVVSDALALEIQTFYTDKGPEEALKAGLDLDYDYLFEIWEHGSLKKAVNNGNLKIENIRKSAKRHFKTWFKLGLFDPPEMVPYSKISENIIASKEHTNTALQASRESIVLLKNKGDILPLNKNIDSLAVIGPSANATDYEVYSGGDYAGEPPYFVTPLEGIENTVSPTTKINSVTGPAKESIKKAKKAANNSEVTILVLGSPEEGEFRTRKDLSIPKNQQDLLKTVINTGTPTITVLINGSPLSSTWMKENATGIIEAWYPGMEGGNAIADVIFGNYNPGGMLSMTIPKLDKEPIYYNHKKEINYNENTYLWPFGYGLSYTSFSYENLRIQPEEAGVENIQVRVDIKNVGERRGSKVVQLYLKDVNASIKTPVKELKGFKRVELNPGEQKTVGFKLTPYQLSLLDKDFDRVLENGKFTAMIGKSSENIIIRENFEITKSAVLENLH